MYKSITKVVSSVAFSILMTSVPGLASAQESADDKRFGYSSRYGVVTPGQVYSLQLNFDSILKYYFNNYKSRLASEINAVELVEVSGKTPQDAFVMLNQLSSAIDKLTRSRQIQPVERVKKQKAQAIPAEVYLQAGHNLDTFSRYLAVLEPDAAFGDYFIVKQNSGITPSHVYALSLQSLRKLNIALR